MRGLGGAVRGLGGAGRGLGGAGRSSAGLCGAAGGAGLYTQKKNTSLIELMYNDFSNLKNAELSFTI